jgi:hypothetical protein
VKPKRRPGPKVEPEADTIDTRLTVKVDAVTKEMLKVVGAGNLSRGVRKAARVAYDKYQRE